MDWFSLLLPFAYLGILVTSLYTFSHLYRTRKAAKARSLTPWFPAHLQRNVYLSLLELSSQPATSSSAGPGAKASGGTTKVPDSVLKAALLRRATEDIHRILAIRQQKPALGQLLQRGSVGDELWQRFQLAEKEMEEELRDVVEEANALQAGWGQTVFQSASEAAHNELLRQKVRDMEARRAVEREEWTRARDSVRAGFLKELSGGGGAAPAAAGGVGAGAHAARGDKDDGKKAGSVEDDTVIVESSGPVMDVQAGDTAGGGGGGGTSARKKKNKK